MALDMQAIIDAVDDFIDAVNEERQLGLTNRRLTRLTDLGLDPDALELLDFEVQRWEVEVVIAAADKQKLQAGVHEVERAVLSTPTLGVEGIMKTAILKAEQTGEEPITGAYKTVLRIKVENKTS